MKSQRKIMVTNTPGVLTETVAEHTITLLFAITRRIVEADKFTRAGRYKGWEPLLFLGSDVAGKTLGIVGLGRIGGEISKRMNQGFGLKNKWIKGAALDVFEFEPKLVQGSAKLDNIILTPHIASATEETRNKMAELAAKNIGAVLSGKTPPNLIK